MRHLEQIEFFDFSKTDIEFCVGVKPLKTNNSRCFVYVCFEEIGEKNEIKNRTVILCAG